MRKIALLLSIIIILAYCTLLSGCHSKSDQNESNTAKEITLTKDNFKNYFTIEVDSNVTTTKHGDSYVLGVYVPATYSAVADVNVNVFSNVPIDSYNVKVTLEIKTGYVYWNTKTVTLNISSNGSASKKLTITTSDAQTIFFESDCNRNFYASIVSVEGTIREH